jgi:hypothetical protein
MIRDPPAPSLIPLTKSPLKPRTTPFLKPKRGQKEEFLPVRDEKKGERDAVGKMRTKNTLA